MGGDNGPLNVYIMTQVINFELISVEIIVHCMVVVFRVDFFSLSQGTVVPSI